MANLKASKKDITRSKRNQDRRKHLKTILKTAIKHALNAIESKNESAAAIIQKTCQVVDKSCAKGIIKKNTAGRKKSRLMKALNQATLATQ